MKRCMLQVLEWVQRSIQFKSIKRETVKKQNSKHKAGICSRLLWAAMGAVQMTAAAWLFYDNILAVLLMSPWLYFYIKEKSRQYYSLKKHELTTQFKDAVTAVSFSLNAGYSVENAFVEALKELKLLYGQKAEIVREFSEIARRLQNNENIEEVLSSFASESGVSDIIYFSEVFQYAKRSGGDLVSIIRNTANTIRAKIELQEEIYTTISGKKMEQRIMGIMPFAMIAYLRLTSPEFISSVYGNAAGTAVMSVCLCVYLAADKMAKRIVNIEI